jgi:hypothetical protein
MERSEIRELVYSVLVAPDYASLHPGYEGTRRGLFLVKRARTIPLLFHVKRKQWNKR